MSSPDPPSLLVVSAHFPPDFVSGGTLVPDRQARGLQAQGWEVSVFAGSLDPGRPPLATWQEIIDGLHVRWIAIGPFTGWSDRRNFDHPAVADQLAAVLEEHPVDIVHLHSLQSLGAGLVRVAKRSGAATVVTMHDFWWCCARQFLADREWVPCSLVVDAGVCGCEVDQAWLRERNAWLARELEHADLVLAPSTIAAQVLAANGVPADRMRVDENGLPPVPSPPRARSRRPPIRFRYAGGPDRMKGSAVVLEAARQLLQLRPHGWQLLVHGDPDEMQAVFGRTLPSAVEVLAPFAPEDIDEVMADTDLLVVPSIMRESHSLLTREALLRGVPVLASDSLGPEEVVVSDRNGLVLPTGDPQALSSAMRSVLDDPDRLERWSQRASTVEMRSAANQMASLDATLRNLAVEPPRAPASTPGGTITRVLFVVGIDGAPLRYRAHLPAEALATLGVHSDVRHYRDPELAALADRADAVVVYRVPATIQVLDLIERTKARQPVVPVLFDVDDLIFDPELAAEIPALRILPEDEAALWLQGVERYRTTMEVCDAFIGSTEGLCAHARLVVGIPAHRFANGVGLQLARCSDIEMRRPPASGPPRIGYFSGTTTHDRDWAVIEEAVLAVLDRHPDAELWLGGHLNPSPAVDRLGPRLRRVPVVEWRSLPPLLRDLRVSLAPLEPLGRFNEAKSAIKWVEAALCGTPTIASPTQPFLEVIDPGVNGFIATTPADWIAHLDELLSDQAVCRRVGDRARRDALLSLSPALQATRYLDILERTKASVGSARRSTPSGSLPVVWNEPPESVALLPYEAEIPPVSPPLSRPWGRRAAAAIGARARAVRQETIERGVWSALGRSLVALRRDLRRMIGSSGIRRRGRHR